MRTLFRASFVEEHFIAGVYLRIDLSRFELNTQEITKPAQLQMTLRFVKKVFIEQNTQLVFTGGTQRSLDSALIVGALCKAGI